MNGWRESFRAVFINNVSLTNVVGNRIYFEVAPPDANAPFIVFSDVSQEAMYSHEGDSGLDEHLVQVAVWAKTADQAHEIRTIARSVSQLAFPQSPIIGRMNATALRTTFDQTSNLRSAQVDIKFFSAPAGE